jgi:type III secretory pathway component EscT
MHKDPPPTLLERSITEIVIHGMVVGFVASVVFFGAWALVANGNMAPRNTSAPLPVTTNR